MGTFLVYTPDNKERSDYINAKFISDGIAWTAFILPNFWLIRNKQWWMFSTRVIMLILLTVFVYSKDDNFSYALFCILIIAGFLVLQNLLLLLEGNNILQRDLEKNGYQLADIIEANNYKNAEFLFYHRLSNKNQKMITRLPITNNNKHTQSRKSPWE